MAERIPFRPRPAASYNLADLPPIRGGAEPPQAELRAPTGTYQFLETALAQYADPLRQMGLKLHSFERDGTHLDVYRSRQQRGETPSIHLTICQPSGEQFCDVISSADITPDDLVKRLSANWNMMGKSRGLPKPKPDLDKLLQTARHVLEDPSVLMG